MCNDDTTEPEIRDLEMIDWVKNGEDLPTVAFRDGKIVENRYVTFKELFDVISEFGPLVHKNEIATLIFMPLSDEFEDDIMAVRASGRNIRRFLLREDTFESAFDDFQGCIDHLISNNTVECELEVRHIYDMAEKLDLLSMAPEPGRQYDRLEIDLIAALQLMHVKEKIVKNTGGPEFLFELGFSVGRLFSSAQNLATLEDDAQKAGEYEATCN